MTKETEKCPDCGKAYLVDPYKQGPFCTCTKAIFESMNYAKRQADLTKGVRFLNKYSQAMNLQVHWAKELIALRVKQNDHDRAVVAFHRSIGKLLEENQKLRERLNADPGGTDRIDELEQMVARLGEKLEEAEKEAEKEADHATDRMVGVLNDLDKLTEERDRLRAYKRAVKRSQREKDQGKKSKKTGLVHKEMFEQVLQERDQLRAELEKIEKAGGK